MPRPCKRRRICSMPCTKTFGPRDSTKISGFISMTLDEYEAIRLIDLEGLTQEECADHMEVARTTAQAIYGSARTKLAKCLVHGCELKIQGGEYFLCEGTEKGCGCGHCRKKGGII